jgi:hypothetical protein
MRRVVFDLRLSLDGIIARLNDEIDLLQDWIFTGDTNRPKTALLQYSKIH